MFEKLETFATATLESRAEDRVSCELDPSSGSNACTPAPRSVDEGVKICLEIFYYWVNFAPLSRGSAATGYSALIGCMASLGELPAAPLPRGVQIDWLGILSTSPAQFVSAVYPYVASRTPLQKALPAACWDQLLQEVAAECRVSGRFNTARDILFALNMADDSDSQHTSRGY